MSFIQRLSQRTHLAAGLACAAAIAGGCSDDDDGGSGESTYDQPLFAVASTLSTADESVTYINVLSDLAPQQLDYSQAVQYPGFTTVLGVDGKLYIANGEAPIVERFAVDDAHRIAADGTIGFGNVTDSVAFFSHIYASPTKGYFELGTGGVDLVSWNPRDLTVGSVVSAPAGIPLDREGLHVYGSYDRGVAVRGSQVFQPVYWVDDDFYRFSPTSQIALYDAATDQATGVIDAPCTNLDVSAQDEAGNLYFSNWVYSASAPLFDPLAPEPCLVTVRAGQSTVDPAGTIHFPELTGGRQGAAFRYLANGKGLLTVFHDERLTGDEDPLDAVFSTNWKFWLVDLAAKTAEPLQGLDYVAPGYYMFRIDGRTFLLVPNEEMTETVVYEVSDTGATTELFTARGWAYQLIKIR